MRLLSVTVLLAAGLALKVVSEPLEGVDSFDVLLDFILLLTIPDSILDITWISASVSRCLFYELPDIFVQDRHVNIRSVQASASC